MLSQPTSSPSDQFFFQDPSLNSTYDLTIFNTNGWNFEGLIKDFVSNCNAMLLNTSFNAADFISFCDESATDVDGTTHGYIISRMINDLVHDDLEHCLIGTSSDYLNSIRINNLEQFLIIFFAALALAGCFCGSIYRNRRNEAQARENINNNQPVQDEHDQGQELNHVYHIFEDEADPTQSFQWRLANLDDFYKKDSVPVDLRTSYGLIMNDPVTVQTGVTYDRQELAVRFISGENNTAAQVNCTVTDLPIYRDDFLKLKTNIIIKNRIENYVNHCVKASAEEKPNLSFIEHVVEDINQQHDHTNYERRLEKLKNSYYDYHFEIPEDMLDLHYQVMEKPITLISGMTYSRKDIRELIRLANAAGLNHFCCPKTRIEIPNDSFEAMRTDITIDNWIMAFVEKHERQFEIRKRTFFQTLNNFDRVLVNLNLPPLSRYAQNARNRFFGQGYAGLNTSEQCISVNDLPESVDNLEEGKKISRRSF